LAVGFCDEAIDGGLKLDDRFEDAAFEPLPGEFGKQPFDRIDPRARGWGEMESEALMPLQPSFDVGVLVGGVVVEDDMDCLVGRHLAFDSIEKADEFLVPVAACSGR